LQPVMSAGLYITYLINSKKLTGENNERTTNTRNPSNCGQH